MPISKTFFRVDKIMFPLPRSKIFLSSTVQTDSGASPVSYTIVTQNAISLGRDDGSRDVFSVLFETSYSCKSTRISLHVYVYSQVQGKYYVSTYYCSIISKSVYTPSKYLNISTPAAAYSRLKTKLRGQSNTTVLLT
jgi:hypothetical protein